MYDDNVYTIELSDMSVRRAKSDINDYFNREGFLVYNGNANFKYRDVQIPKTKRSGGKPVIGQDGKPETVMSDSLAMTKGWTNIIQQGGLPAFQGSTLPPKYWKLAGGKLEAMTQAERDAVDAAEAGDRAKRDRRNVLERRITNRQRRDAIAAVHADTDMTVAERDELLGEITGG
jgi:hypothetical protein